MRAIASPIPLDPPVISAARSAMRAAPYTQPRLTGPKAFLVLLRAMLMRLITAPLVLLLALGAAGCGSSGDDSNGGDSAGPTAKAGDFPSTATKTMGQIKRSLGGGGPVLAPTVQQLDVGTQRYGFALFTTARKQIAGAPVALYLQKQGTSKTYGPFVTRDLSLAVKKQYESKTVANDPDAAKTLYVGRVPFKKPGIWAVMAVAKLDGRLVASDPIGARVLARDPVPNVGDRAPAVETPTVKSVGGDVAKIDTRQPPDDMHDVSLKDVVGKKPVILVFATPALCQSRVCGPVVDIAQELKAEHPGEAAFIHMEIYRGNTIKNGCLEGTRAPSQCLRPQVLAYHLPTEPGAFAIDRRGKIVARLEGAYSKSELESALQSAVRR